MKMKWEYHIETTNCIGANANNLGRDGWEMVSCCPYKDDSYPWFVVIYKRPLKGDINEPHQS